MSQENVEIVRLAYKALAVEGLDRFMEHFTDDVDYRGVTGTPDDMVGAGGDCVSRPCAAPKPHGPES
jgi:ketosteroid isomerase-like protein